MTINDFTNGFFLFIVLAIGLILWLAWPGKKSAKVQYPKTPNWRNYIKKPWGGEDLWASTPLYVGKVLEIKAGQQLSKQYHKVKDESLMVLSGQMKLFLKDETSESNWTMNPGDSVHIPPGVIHRMTAITDVRVVEVSTPELSDVVRLEDDYGREDGKK